MDDQTQPAAARSSGVLIGALCGIASALAWAAGFVAAKHGVAVGFSPADLALHRFLWSGLLLMPLVLRDGIGDLGGIGWKRGLPMSILAGPPQAMLAYTGFMLVPLGHGTTIQPACAALSGLILATLLLGERATVARIIGGTTIIAGLLVFGAESIATIGSHGVGGDLLFATAGLFWAIFGVLLRYWQVSGTRAVAAVGALSVVDAQGRVVPTASNSVRFAVRGAGVNAGVGNGDPSSHEPNLADTRNAFNGLCMVLVKAARQGGTIRLTAAADGLAGAELVFTAG